MKGYKFVTDTLESTHNDTKWVVREWKKHDGKLELCASGFHASRTPYGVSKFAIANRLFVVESRGDVLEEEHITYYWKKVTCKKCKNERKRVLS